jgi:hypothetical protein
MTDRGRYQAYANYVDAAGVKRFRSLGTYETLARAVGARTVFHLVQCGDAPLIALMMLDSTYSS